jgi:methyltransferase-like protein
VRPHRAALRRAVSARGAYHLIHPDHLATLALLNGVETAPPRRCRVLTLGMAESDILPMAVELPDSTFTGVSARMEGPFDYILCDDAFSRVGEDGRQKMLAMCRALLAPNGVVCIGYQTYPGWHLRQQLREMLTYHTRDVDDPAQKSARAQELVQFLAETAGNGDDAHARFLREAQQHFDLDEYLLADSEPVYFRDFAARAALHGLQYAGEADAHDAEIDNLAPETARKLRALAGNTIDLQQYLDFVVNRAYRRSLLVHAGTKLDRTMTPARMRRMYVASACRPTSAEPDLRDVVSESFVTEAGKTFSSEHAVTKAALVELAARWPRAIAFDELVAGVAARLALANVRADLDEVLPDVVHALFWSGVVALHVAPPQCTERVSERPCASELARAQASAGVPVLNQRRRAIRLDDPLASFLLPLLDGTRDRASLLRLLDETVAAGRLDIRPEGGQIPDPSRIPSVLEALLDHHLKKMAQMALLVE